MSLDKNELQDLMLSKMSANPDNQSDAFEALADAIVEYIKSNLEVDIPRGAVIDTVTGGSGAPAVGITNIDKIACTVK